MSRHRMVITAHPDDETIFFGGTILHDRASRWTVVCVTDGGAAPRADERMRELAEACDLLGVHEHRVLGFRDDPDERLPIHDVARALLPLLGDVDEIVTHGPLGEYGHPHHRDVLAAVMAAVAANHRTTNASAPIRVLASAWNVEPDLAVSTLLTPEELDRKRSITCTTYHSETQSFLGLLPVHAFEPLRSISSHDYSSSRRWIEHCNLPARSFQDPAWSSLLSIDPRQYQRSFQGFLSAYRTGSSSTRRSTPTIRTTTAS